MVQDNQAGDPKDNQTGSHLGGQAGGVVKGLLIFFFGVIVLSVVAVGAGAYLAQKEIKRAGPLTEQTIVQFKNGSSVNAIGETLAENNIIRNADLFKVAVRLRKAQGALKAGEYQFSPGLSVEEVIDVLMEGNSILHFVTIPEGRTTAQILKILQEDPVLTGDITITPREGALLPETYGFSRGDSRDMIITRMMKDQQKVIEELWETRKSGLPLSNPRDAIILASIVEKETGVAGERDRIAAVFINRLNRKMRLESDPTIIYGLTQGEPLGRGLRVSEIRGETPYNTYVINGLPPTPICNPGKASIEAVLNPSDSEEIFFVADGTGGHAFAKTLREHNANVRKWRRIEGGRR